MNVPPPVHLRIWQQNVNRSLIAQLHVLNTARPSDWDIILLQEPWIGSINTRTTPFWTPLYPDIFLNNRSTTPRSLILVNNNIPSDSYTHLLLPSLDASGIQIKVLDQTLIIINIYNACDHNDTLHAVSAFLSPMFPDDHVPENTHVILGGDFNRHHPLWEEPRNSHLKSSELLLLPLMNIIRQLDLRMALPPCIPTLEALSTRNWTRPDNVWCSSHSTDLFIRCTTDPGLRAPNTDHLPIVYTLDIPVPRSAKTQTRNFRATNWAEFTSTLSAILDDSPKPRRIRSHQEFRSAISTLNAAIASSIAEHVPLSTPAPFTKRWWTPQLSALRKKKNRLSNLSYRWRGLPDHYAHADHKATVKEYAKLIESTKKQHWESWLENASDRDLWTANKYASNPPSDGGKTRIPDLVFKEADGSSRHTNSNDEKSIALAESFFPPPPLHPSIPHSAYPEPADFFSYFTRDHIKRVTRKLPAYKAPGPDGVPNVVLKESISVIINHLFFIFKAIFQLKVYPDEWRESITVVLRKPGKPAYDLPKAYRPIALLNSMGKLFSTLMADELSYFCETRNIFPDNQFGGRPSRTTSDSLLLLTHKIKDAWRAGKVASVLFLDVQGAFPNVVKEVLIHIMRSRAVPPQYIHITELMLSNRKTKLSFDDFLSDFIPINNGNNQGCPLSMLFYAFYNTGLLELSPPGSRDECQFGYVDDVALLATGKSFADTHGRLTAMMERPGGAFDWSDSHNSKFELSKLALMNFSFKRAPDSPLTITHPHSRVATVVNAVKSYKFLGVLLDSRLRWNLQADRATHTADAWVNLIRRLARTSRGISARGMRLLYTAVAIPKMGYAADVWYSPPHRAHSTAARRSGMLAISNKLQSAQRKATINMLGAMCTTAGDVLNAHANLPPPHLLLLEILTRSATRLLTLPPSHPLHKPSLRAAKRAVKRHRSPLHTLFLTTNVSPAPYETILSCRRRRNVPFLANTHIDNDRESAIAYADSISGITVYTDGSGYKKNIGAAAVLMLNDTVLETLHYHLGHETEHTVYEAEAVAVILGLHLLASSKRKMSRTTIGTDNQAVLLGMRNQKSRPAHHLMDRIHDLLNDFQVAQARIRRIQVPRYRMGTGRTKLDDGSLGWIDWELEIQTKLNFVWTPGHEGIAGNEIADKEAKKAAQGHSSDADALPAFLRGKPLPVSISATRQFLKKKIKARWLADWRSSPRFPRMSTIDCSLPTADFLEIISQLRRNQASLLIQLRTNHIPLNETLHRIKRSDSASCPHCRGNVKDTVHHLLLLCPHYANARRVLQSRLGRDSSSIPFLLSSRAGIPDLLRFISDTNRLTATFGEVRPDDDFVFKEKEKQTPHRREDLSD